MKLFPRLLCLLLVATAALAESPANTAPDIDEQPAPALQTRPAANDIVLPTATVLRIRLNQPISTATARVGERFQATLAKPVEANGEVLLPAGSVVSCRLDRADGPRRFRGRPVLAIKAIGAWLPNGDQLEFNATVVDTSSPKHLDVDEGGRVRGADANPMNKIETAALGGSGAVAGVIVAGPQGLLIGAGTGVAVAAGHILVKHRDLTLPTGTELIFELDAPATHADRHHSEN